MLKLPQIKKMHPFMFAGLENNHNNPSINSIVSSIVKITGIEFIHIQSLNRERAIVDARHLFCYFVKKNTDLSFKEIGEIINKNHATVIHASNKIKSLIQYDRGFKELVPKIENLISKYERVATN